MLSLAGEHLVVQICFMFHLFLTCSLCWEQSAPSIGATNLHSSPGTARIPGECQLIAHEEHNLFKSSWSICDRFYFRQIHLMFLMGAWPWQDFRGTFEMHRRVGTGNHCESASILCTVKNEHLGRSLPTDTRCHFRWTHRLKRPAWARCSQCSTASDRLL